MNGTNYEVPHCGAFSSFLGANTLEVIREKKVFVNFIEQENGQGDECTGQERVVDTFLLLSKVTTGGVLLVIHRGSIRLSEHPSAGRVQPRVPYGSLLRLLHKMENYYQVCCLLADMYFLLMFD